MLIQTKVDKDKDTTLNPYLITAIEKRDYDYDYENDEDKEYYLYISMLTSEDHYYKRTFKDKKERDAEYELLVAEWTQALNN